MSRAAPAADTPDRLPPLSRAWRVYGWKRALAWLPETLGLAFWMGAMRLLSPEAASNLGGWLGRTLGPRLAVTQVARRNLRLAFPDLPRAREEEILRACWDNLGRTAAEYPHLGAIMDPAAGRLELHGTQYLRPETRDPRGVIAWSGHFCNWEVMACLAAQCDPESVTVVRDPNNRLVARLIERYRAVVGGYRVNKGRQASRTMVSTLRAGGLIAVLLDQRLSDGVDATLFGQPAKSPSGAAMMALRLNLSMHPTEIERAGPARYRITVHPAMDLPQEGDLESRTQQVVEACNRQLEAWITARPHEWLWMHRRWEKATYRDLGLIDRE